MSVIENKFNSLKIVKKDNETMETYCTPKKYKLQSQQTILPLILTDKIAPWNSTDNIHGILLYHQIGSGKTCTSIRIAEEFKKKLKILIILPASLISNFLDELRSQCTNNEYITIKERESLTKLTYEDDEYHNIINKSNERISKYYTIYSYHKLINLIKEDKIKNFNNTLVIIDEIQNMISLNGIFYKLLHDIIYKSNKTFKIVLLTATPIVDRPIEIALIMNLLKKNNFDILSFNTDFMDNKYKLINKELFKNKLTNLISYYRGAPPIAFPKVNFKIIRCNMSTFQYKSYLTSLSSNNNLMKGSFKNVNILKLSENFYLGPRIISNIAFPNKSIGDEGYNSLTGKYLQMKNINLYSIKFYKIIQKINQSEGPVFVYSGFKEEGGIKSFIKFIEYHGWKNYIIHGEEKKRYVSWSIDETQQIKNEIKFNFNQKKNTNGSVIKLLLGTPSIKEGVSLLRVEQVHIMEPYWNKSRITQIMGRAIRFCSHLDLPKKKRLVNVYLYIAKYKDTKTIDQYIWSIAKKKEYIIAEFQQLMKETAIDCNLFYNMNNYSTDEEHIKCNL